MKKETRKSKITRTISFLTLGFFLVNQAVFANPGAGIEVALKGERPSFLNFVIPEELGTVEALYEAPSATNPQFILHIQDAHANYQAQMKIKQLLGYMDKKYGFKTIFVEGASEKLNADYLRLFPDEESNLKLCDELAKQGELTGAEYYLMEAGKKSEALGIEEASFYKANYEALKKVFGASADVTRFFKGFDAKLDQVASKTLTPETRALISDWKRFEQGRREFMPFVSSLAKRSKAILHADLESLFAQVSWPQISRLLVLQQMEKDLSREKAAEEQAALLKTLRGKGVSRELLAALEDFGEGSVSVGKSVHEVSPRELLERLAAEAGPKGFKFSDFPNFSLFAGHVILRSELDPQGLFEEIEYLFTQMLDALTREPKQKALLALYRDGELLRKLLRLELNRAQWQQAVEAKDRIAVPSLVARLQEMAGASGDTAASQGPQGMSGAFGKKMNGVLHDGLEFYELARQRENVFYQRMQTVMAERKLTKAILVTGGFHADGMSDLFRENAVSYGIVTPRLSERSDENLYRTTMLQGRESLFSISYLQMAAKLMPDIAKIAQGVNVAQVYEVILNAMMRVGEKNIDGVVHIFNESLLAKDNGIMLVRAKNNVMVKPVFKIAPRAAAVAIPAAFQPERVIPYAQEAAARSEARTKTGQIPGVGPARPGVWGAGNRRLASILGVMLAGANFLGMPRPMTAQTATSHATYQMKASTPAAVTEVTVLPGKPGLGSFVKEGSRATATIDRPNRDEFSVTYDVSGNKDDFAGASLSFGYDAAGNPLSQDLSDLGALTFEMKREKTQNGTCVIIEIQDARYNPEDPSTNRYRAQLSISHLGTNYDKISIPIAEIKRLYPFLDLGAVKTIAFVFTNQGVSDKKGTLFVKVGGVYYQPVVAGQSALPATSISGMNLGGLGQLGSTSVVGRVAQSGPDTFSFNYTVTPGQYGGAIIVFQNNNRFNMSEKGPAVFRVTGPDRIGVSVSDDKPIGKNPDGTTQYRSVNITYELKDGKYVVITPELLHSIAEDFNADAITSVSFVVDDKTTPANGTVTVETSKLSYAYPITGAEYKPGSVATLPLTPAVTGTPGTAADERTSTATIEVTQTDTKTGGFSARSTITDKRDFTFSSISWGYFDKDNNNAFVGTGAPVGKTATLGIRVTDGRVLKVEFLNTKGVKKVFALTGTGALQIYEFDLSDFEGPLAAINFAVDEVGTTEYAVMANGLSYAYPVTGSEYQTGSIDTLPLTPAVTGTPGTTTGGSNTAKIEVTQTDTKTGGFSAQSVITDKRDFTFSSISWGYFDKDNNNAFVGIGAPVGSSVTLGLSGTEGRVLKVEFVNTKGVKKVFAVTLAKDPQNYKFDLSDFEGPLAAINFVVDEIGTTEYTVMANGLSYAYPVTGAEYKTDSVSALPLTPAVTGTSGTTTGGSNTAKIEVTQTDTKTGGFSARSVITDKRDFTFSSISWGYFDKDNNNAFVGIGAPVGQSVTFGIAVTNGRVLKVEFLNTKGVKKVFAVTGTGKLQSYEFDLSDFEGPLAAINFVSDQVGTTEYTVMANGLSYAYPVPGTEYKAASVSALSSTPVVTGNKGTTTGGSNSATIEYSQTDKTTGGFSAQSVITDKRDFTFSSISWGYFDKDNNNAFVGIGAPVGQSVTFGIVVTDGRVLKVEFLNTKGVKKVFAVTGNGQLQSYEFNLADFEGPLAMINFVVDEVGTTEYTVMANGLSYAYPVTGAEYKTDSVSALPLTPAVTGTSGTTTGGSNTAKIEVTQTDTKTGGFSARSVITDKRDFTFSSISWGYFDKDNNNAFVGTGVIAGKSVTLGIRVTNGRVLKVEFLNTKGVKKVFAVTGNGQLQSYEFNLADFEGPLAMINFVADQVGTTEYTVMANGLSYAYPVTGAEYKAESITPLPLTPVVTSTPGTATAGRTSTARIEVTQTDTKTGGFSARSVITDKRDFTFSSISWGYFDKDHNNAFVGVGAPVGKSVTMGIGVMNGRILKVEFLNTKGVKKVFAVTGTGKLQSYEFDLSDFEGPLAAINFVSDEVGTTEYTVMVNGLTYIATIDPTTTFGTAITPLPGSPIVSSNVGPSDAKEKATIDMKQIDAGTVIVKANVPKKAFAFVTLGYGYHDKNGVFYGTGANLGDKVTLGFTASPGSAGKRIKVEFVDVKNVKTSYYIYLTERFSLFTFNPGPGLIAYINIVVDMEGETGFTMRTQGLNYIPPVTGVPFNASAVSALSGKPAVAATVGTVTGFRKGGTANFVPLSRNTVKFSSLLTEGNFSMGQFSWGYFDENNRFQGTGGAIPAGNHVTLGLSGTPGMVLKVEFVTTAGQRLVYQVALTSASTGYTFDLTPLEGQLLAGIYFVDDTLGQTEYTVVAEGFDYRPIVQGAAYNADQLTDLLGPELVVGSGSVSGLSTANIYATPKSVSGVTAVEASSNVSSPGSFTFSIASYGDFYGSSYFMGFGKKIGKNVTLALKASDKASVGRRLKVEIVSTKSPNDKEVFWVVLTEDLKNYTFERKEDVPVSAVVVVDDSYDETGNFVRTSATNYTFYAKRLNFDPTKTYRNEPPEPPLPVIPPLPILTPEPRVVVTPQATVAPRVVVGPASGTGVTPAGPTAVVEAPVVLFTEHTVTREGDYLIIGYADGHRERMLVASQQASLVSYSVSQTGIYLVVDQRGNAGLYYVPFNDVTNFIPVKLPDGVSVRSAQDIVFVGAGTVDITGTDRITRRVALSFSPNSQYQVTYAGNYLEVRYPDGHVERIPASAQQASLVSFNITDKGIYMTGDQRGNASLLYVAFDNIFNPIPMLLPPGVSVRSVQDIVFVGVGIADITGIDNIVRRVDLNAGTIIPFEGYDVKRDGNYLAIRYPDGHIERILVSAQQASLVSYNATKNGIYLVTDQRGNASLQYISFDNVFNPMPVLLPAGVSVRSAQDIVFVGAGIADITEIDNIVRRVDLTAGTIIPFEGYDVRLDGNYLAIRYPDGHIERILVSAQQASLVSYNVTGNGIYIVGDQRGNWYLQYLAFDNTGNRIPVQLPAGVSVSSAQGIVFVGVGIADITGTDNIVRRVNLNTGTIIATRSEMRSTEVRSPRFKSAAIKALMGIYHIDTANRQGVFEPARSEARSPADRSRLIARTVAAVRGLGPQVAEVREARLGFRAEDLKKIEAMVEGTGVSAELLATVLVAAVAGGVAAPEITPEQMSKVLRLIAKAKETPLPVLVQKVREMLAVQDEEGLLIQSMDSGTAIEEADLVPLANSKQHIVVVWTADANHKAALEAKAKTTETGLLKTRSAKDLAIQGRFNIVVVDQAKPMAGLSKLIQQKKAKMPALSRGQQRYVLMGDLTFLDQLNPDTVQGLMISQPQGKELRERMAASILGARVSQEILKVTEASEIKDAVARMLDKKGAKEVYSFKSDVLNAMLGVALQALQAIRSAA